ncbi:FtsX-like permease family protein [Haladaptatus sp. NG-WS-4]
MTGAYVIDTTPERATGQGQIAAIGTGTASPSLYRYFAAGMRDVLEILGLVTICGGALILVVVYNVTRMSVRDRLQAIEVIRATGGTPRQLLLIFGVRAGLLTLTGIILGYALGVIITRAIVTIAIAVGLHITLDPAVTPAVARIILPSLVILLFVGIGAGVLAVRPATTTAPCRLQQTFDTESRLSTASYRHSRLQAFADTTLLRWRAFVPATTILSIFVLIIVVVGALVGTLAPIATTSGGTITEPGAAYPMASRIDAGYADLLRSQGITASPEIIVVQVRNGQPYLARGANYSAFAAVSDATLTAGRTPQTKHEAVIGRDLAQTLNVNIGDTLTIGGATSPAITQVTVVGTFAAPGMQDDQLIVPLATAHDLSTKPGIVHFIRTADRDKRLTQGSQSNGGGIVVSGVSAPTAAVRGQPVSVGISVRNVGTTEDTRRVTVSLGNSSVTRSVSVSPGEQRSVTVNVTARTLGNQTLRVGAYSQSVNVSRRSPVSISSLPAAAPPNATLAVPVRTVSGDNVSAAVVQVGDRTTRTNKNGLAVIQLPRREGVYELAVRKGNRTNSSQIRVVSGTVRQPIGSVAVSPQNASVFTRPTASISLFNPWNRHITREISFVTPTKTVTRTVALAPRTTTTMTTQLGAGSSDKIAPGEYSVRLISNGQTLATDTYRVHGDDRSFSTLAQNTKYTGGTGLGQAIRSVFGNFNLLLIVMVVLAGLTTIGGTTATFAQAVHARRHALGVYRATGATRWHILRILFTDAFRIAIPASLLAVVVTLVMIQTLAFVGLFTVFGLQLETQVPLSLLLVAEVAALVLMFISVFIAALPYLLAEPTTVQRNSSGAEGPTEQRRQNPSSRSSRYESASEQNSNTGDD